MDQELFIIEVLSAKQKLSRKRKKSEKNNVQAFKLSIFLWFAFFRSCIVPISPYECSSPFS